MRGNAPLTSTKDRRMEIIKLQNVKKQYGGKVIFQDVSLNISAGSFVVLRGESGAGKSTLLNLISGLEVPTSGQIIVDGNDIGSLTVAERTNFYRHEIGIIFQGSYLQPQFTLLENITLPGVFAGIPEAERRTRAEQLAQMLGIFDNLKYLPKEVSGGQAERACIARALLLNPKIILADEPTSNLDEENAKTVLDILNYIRQQMGVTIIIASHSRDVMEFATQVVTVRGGAATSELVDMTVMQDNQKATDDIRGTA